MTLKYHSNFGRDVAFMRDSEKRADAKKERAYQAGVANRTAAVMAVPDYLAVPTFVKTTTGAPVTSVAVSAAMRAPIGPTAVPVMPIARSELVMAQSAVAKAKTTAKPSAAQTSDVDHGGAVVPGRPSASLVSSGGGGGGGGGKSAAGGGGGGGTEATSAPKSGGSSLLPLILGGAFLVWKYS